MPAAPLTHSAPTAPTHSNATPPVTGDLGVSLVTHPVIHPKSERPDYIVQALADIRRTPLPRGITEAEAVYNRLRLTPSFYRVEGTCLPKKKRFLWQFQDEQW